MTPEDPNTWITALIRDLCRGPENTLQNATHDPAWDEPLVGISRGDDPLYDAYKQVVGPFHWTPLEIFSATYPDLSVRADELSVISWILPQTPATKADNRAENVYPAERWARSRIFGEAFNVWLRGQVVAALTEYGCPAVAPMLAPQWREIASATYGLASTWSERHAAYASGLGTFGLCDGLITPRGKAMRTGSVVARVRLEPTPRPYSDHHAYCLFYSEHSCGACIARCPVGAISAAGHDKTKCQRHVAKSERYVKTHYGFDGYGCGLCQTGVPCESGIPLSQRAVHPPGDQSAGDSV